MPPSKTQPHYDLQLTINPRRQTLHVQGALHLPPQRDNIPQDNPLSFYLHRQFQIDSLTGDNLSGWQFNTTDPVPVRWLPVAGVLSITRVKAPSKDQPTTLTFAYQGRITERPDWLANVVGPEWTEIGLYLPWFPSNPNLGPFTFDVTVACDPAFEITSYGRPRQQGDHRRFTMDQPTNDIVLTFSPSMDQRDYPAGEFTVHLNSLSLSSDTADTIGGDLAAILRTFQAWFGPGPGGDVTVTQSPREKGGGYTRRGLVMLAGLDDEDYPKRREAYVRYLAHELAHLWWWRADSRTWHDWLNESFAEYSALLMVRESFGPAAFEKRLADKRKTIDQAPPIQGFNPGDCDTDEKLDTIHNLFYNKGPLLLHRLSQKIGPDAFLSLCRKMSKQAVSETAAFLTLLESHSGPQVRDWMSQQLKV
jgi:hypothetical protein